MAKPTFGKTPSVLKFFSECTGFDYPWDKCAMIAVTGFPGGMENTSTTMIGEVLLHDGRVRSPASDSVVAHELAHQWFGDLVTCKDWAHSWLNESFATYFDLLYTEHERGKAEFQRRIMGNQRLGLAASTMRPRPIVYTQYKVVGEMFDQNAYAKGACVLHMLRYVLGERLWWEGVRHYLRKHAYQSVDTDDFRKAMEEKSGCDLKWFFDQWLYGVGHPQFQVRWSWNETAKKVTVAIRQTQSAGATVPVFRTPADLEFKTTTKVHRFKVDITAAQQEFSFQLDNKPQSLVFDPDHWLLCTADVQQD